MGCACKPTSQTVQVSSRTAAFINTKWEFLESGCFKSSRFFSTRLEFHPPERPAMLFIICPGMKREMIPEPSVLLGSVTPFESRKKQAAAVSLGAVIPGYQVTSKHKTPHRHDPSRHYFDTAFAKMKQKSWGKHAWEKQVTQHLFAPDGSPISS